MSTIKDDKIRDFLLGSDVRAMKDLPDNPLIPTVLEGVNLKVDLTNLIGGWELSTEGPRVVWFMLIKDHGFQRLNG